MGLTLSDCQHLSWECSGVEGSPYPQWGACHSCNDCDLQWGTDSPYAKDQIGKCSICQAEGKSVNPNTFITKDSGKREEYESGMVRDTQEGKPRYDLLVPLGVPYEHQFLTRVANLLARGAEKYSDRNWEQAAGSAELDRFQSSAHRHLIQWVTGESDEDHAAAVVFNLLAYETIKWKLENGSGDD